MQVHSQFDPVEQPRNSLGLVSEGAHHDHMIINPHLFSGHDSFDDSLFPRLESIDQKDFQLFGTPSNNYATSTVST